MNSGLESIVSPTWSHDSATGNMRIKVTVRHDQVTIVTVVKQYECRVFVALLI
jgi:uncharacterized protein with FMN-binding domain